MVQREGCWRSCVTVSLLFSEIIALLKKCVHVLSQVASSVSDCTWQGRMNWKNLLRSMYPCESVFPYLFAHYPNSTGRSNLLQTVLLIHSNHANWCLDWQAKGRLLDTPRTTRWDRRGSAKQISHSCFVARSCCCPQSGDVNHLQCSTRIFLYCRYRVRAPFANADLAHHKNTSLRCTLFCSPQTMGSWRGSW